VEETFAKGFIDEVKTLLEKGYDENLNSMQAIGYKEVINYLKGKGTLEETMELVKRNTRRFAKRQLSWFRKDKSINWITLGNRETPQKTTTKLIGLVKNALNTV